MKKPSVPVVVAIVVEKTVPVQIRAIGNVEAYSTVSVKAIVGGELKKVYFHEGQYVNKSERLFTVDTRPYETALEAAQASLARDTALSKKAEEDVRRYTELFSEQLVSREQYEQILANADALKATLRADMSAVENARLQLSYCLISAPISGRTGDLLVDQGNLIKANDDKPMVVINQIQPLYVSFSVPEQFLSEIKKYMAAGKLKMEAFISKNNESSEQGVLTFVDNTVDVTTGTIKIKGTFANKENRLWPGQFVDVVLTLAIQSNAIVVPSGAVLTGQNGQYVFIVKDDLAVESRPVVVNRTLNGESVVEKGLSPGEKVVTDGQLKLAPGVKVEIKTGNEGKK